MADDVREQVEGPQETNILSFTEERSRSSADKTFSAADDYVYSNFSLLAIWHISENDRKTEREEESTEGV